MKYVKMLGLAAVAAAALMAFVGSSTASATVLCKTQGTGSPTGTTCPEGWAYPSGTEIHAVLKTVTKAKLITSFKTIECGKSTTKGKTENEGGATETVKGPVEVLTFEECNCEVVEVKKGGTLEIHWINVLDKNEKGEVTAETGSHNGTLTSSGAEVTTICSSLFGKVHCTYVTNNTDIGELDGGAPAIMTIKGAKIPVDVANSDKLCPEKSEWFAEYEVTSPSPLYVTSHT